MPTPSRRLADHLIPGGLDAFVRDRRNEGMSNRNLTVAIYSATGGQVDISETTLRTWYPQNTSTAA